MNAIFGKRKTPEEMLRQNQRALTRAMREMDRERMKLEQQEKKIIGDIKKMAKQGQMDAVKIMAKDLVRTRRYVKKFIMMKANIQAVSLKIQTLKSNNTMAQAMKGVTKAMATMNRQLKLPQIQKIMMEFEKQSEIMDMKEEMMNDAIDDAMGDEDDEEESDAIVSQVLDELGLNLTDELSSEYCQRSTQKQVYVECIHRRYRCTWSVSADTGVSRFPSLVAVVLPGDFSNP
ncbi:charged multivesicular body protein 2a isoform X1 [Amblyraja radiata]|uniref:charged multivesicular body protein 2a isoform X1 n=1 Tax=Amblyraja radiata TaxID=386614 RepID=UPI0014034E9E|nr:charged multivesicular body protein 2a isoform X1 [Amblyraja radiata]XP_032869488.1 charged multivesicular body protein 2a isoform X1 [Amblyraja radiata]XP_032869489.1 charged multivesicular body protein 2a isoform X1 [Amblyraja radiata]XP_032869490.1 charged multivesicular body protein 2a isoform X1 [Amblyraja radiata]